MIKRTILLKSIFICVLFISTAYANDYLKIISEKPGGIIKFNIKTFLGSDLLDPFKEKLTEEIEKEEKQPFKIVMEKGKNSSICSS